MTGRSPFAFVTSLTFGSVSGHCAKCCLWIISGKIAPEAPASAITGLEGFLVVCQCSL